MSVHLRGLWPALIFFLITETSCLLWQVTYHLLDRFWLENRGPGIWTARTSFSTWFYLKIPQKPYKKLRTSINFFLTSKHPLIIKNKLKEYKNLTDPIDSSWHVYKETPPPLKSSLLIFLVARMWQFKHFLSP